MPFIILTLTLVLLGSFSLGGMSALIPGFENAHTSFLLPFLFCVFFLDGRPVFRLLLLLSCGFMIALYDLMLGGFSDFYSFSVACFVVILFILLRSSFYSVYQVRFFPSYLCFSFVLALMYFVQYFGASFVNELHIPIATLMREAALNIVVFPIIYFVVKIAQNPEAEHRGLE